MLLPIDYPTLSFRELAIYTAKLNDLLAGAKIERVFIPEVIAHAQGFFKNTAALAVFTTAQKTATLELSVRPKACGLILHQAGGLKIARRATASVLELTLQKELTGGVIESLEAVPGDRVVSILVRKNGSLFTLLLSLIPAKPKMELHSGRLSQPAREISNELLAKIPLRTELIEDLNRYQALWSKQTHLEAVKLRKDALLSELDHQIKTADRKLTSLKTQAQENENEPDWAYYGKLLQTHFYAKPQPKSGFFTLHDYEKEMDVQIPADAKLDLKAQLEKFFHLAKRKQRRETDTAERILTLEAKLNLLEARRFSLQSTQSWAEIKSLLPAGNATMPQGQDRKLGEKLVEFGGKQYVSQEGLTILSGRNSIENAELTFKVARGNDLWFHVKGRPGSHTVVILPPKRTASLETMLDAAEVCVLHSGGKDWGRTEVDYTLRKHVKKIKNQSEVSYTHNKTLVVQVSDVRLKRLFQDQNENV